MALETNMKNSEKKIVNAFRKYAADQKWLKGDYRILIEVNSNWGRIHIVFVAKRFPGVNPEDGWLSVIDSLEKTLCDEPELLDSMNLTLRTFDEVEQGGLYRLSPDYVDVDEITENQHVD